MNDGPLIVQSDKTLLLEIDHERAQDCRKAIAPFAELERSPEHVHTYRLTPLGLWNARAAGHDAEQVDRHAARLLPLLRAARAARRHRRDHGALRAAAAGEAPRRTGWSCHHRPARCSRRCCAPRRSSRCSASGSTTTTVVVHPSERGNLKQALLKLGWPAEDFAGYVDGEAHAIDLAEDGWALRTYQREAAESFWHGGSGVVVLPCGAGKTIVGAAAMAQAQATTLILVTNTVSARQWKEELLRRTSLTEDEIGEYSGTKKEIRPVTIATYQVMTTRRKGVYAHLELFDARDWGLVVYDEVHLLPAPIFRMTADLQARRRLGLTATLIREDGREGDVFSLIGPKRYDAPWKDIEAQGWIAPADCVEVRVTLPEGERFVYATAEPEERYRLASCTGAKTDVVEQLVAKHRGRADAGDRAVHRPARRARRAARRPGDQGRDPGQGAASGCSTRSGTASSACWSCRKVANFSIDLPEAAVAIQVSGSFGSRQEEAQRLGRLLRPKEDGRSARFYAVVTRDTVDADFAQHRQRFLAEQGYAYRIIDADDIAAES